MNPNKSKLQPEKTGPATILNVNKNNTYLVQGLGPLRKNKTLHHNRLRPCIACHKQRTAINLVPADKLIAYGAQISNNLSSLPKTPHTESTTLKEEEVSQQQICMFQPEISGPMDHIGKDKSKDRKQARQSQIN